MTLNYRKFYLRPEDRHTAGPSDHFRLPGGGQPELVQFPVFVEN